MTTMKVIFALCILTITTRAEIISSIYEMQSLIDTQGAVIESLELYLKEHSEKLEYIKRYLQLNKEEYNKAIIDKENYLKNPINSYKLVKRLTLDLSFVEDLSRKNIEIKRSESMKYPTHEDFTGAVSGLLRLQDLYDLKTSQLANGTLTGRFSENKIEYTEYVAPMTISDCMEMGTVEDNSKDYNRSISWLKEALQKRRNGELDIYYNTTEAEIMDAIIYAYFEANDVKSQESWISQRIQITPHNDGELETKKKLKYYYNFSTIYQPYHSATWKKISINDSIVREPELKRLCLGDVSVPANVTKRLSCWYKSGPHPFLRLARVRTELLHRAPDVLLFHNVMSDAEIQHIQEIAKPRMVRSNAIRKTTVNEDGTETVTTVIPTFRVSQVAWLSADLTKMLKQVSARTSHFTDLSMKSAEPFQVANYGIGGHYDIHYDYFLESEEHCIKAQEDCIKFFNNRIATVLFYMSDVEQGGATAFSYFNLTMYPKKGSAIFWMNLLPNGDRDVMTQHTACPLLRGNKWASNRWIYQHGQEFIRPCPAVQNNKKKPLKIPI